MKKNVKNNGKYFQPSKAVEELQEELKKESGKVQKLEKMMEREELKEGTAGRQDRHGKERLEAQVAQSMVGCMELSNETILQTTTPHWNVCVV